MRHSRNSGFQILNFTNRVGNEKRLLEDKFYRNEGEEPFNGTFFNILLVVSRTDI